MSLCATVGRSPLRLNEAVEKVPKQAVLTARENALDISDHLDRSGKRADGRDLRGDRVPFDHR